MIADNLSLRIQMVGGREVLRSELSIRKQIGSEEFLTLCSKCTRGLVYLIDVRDGVCCYYAVELADCPTTFHRWLLGFLPKLHENLVVYHTGQTVDSRFEPLTGEKLMEAFNIAFPNCEILGSRFRIIQASAVSVSLEEFSSYLGYRDLGMSFYFLVNGQAYIIPDKTDRLEILLNLTFTILVNLLEEYCQFFVQSASFFPLQK